MQSLSSAHDISFVSTPTAVLELPKSLIWNYTSRSSHVFVEALPCVANATSVQLEPLSKQDWELLQQHADQLEGGDLLQQISLVYPGQILPFQLGAGRTATVRVLPIDVDDDEQLWPAKKLQSLPPCVRLVAQTEVVVAGPQSGRAPKELRVVPCLEEYTEFVQQLRTDDSYVMSLPHPYTVAVHPNALSHTAGWREDDNEQLVSVRRVKSDGPERTLSAVAKLVPSIAVPDGCVGTYLHLACHSFELSVTIKTMLILK